MPPDAALAAYLSILATVPEFQQLRKVTVMDKNMAAAGSIRLYTEMMRPKQSNIKTAKQLADNVDNLAGLPADVAESAKQALNTGQQGLAQHITNDTEAQAVAKAVTTTADTIQAITELAGFDTGGDATSRVLDYLLDEALVTRVSKMDKLRAVLKLAGRLRIILSAAKSTKPVPAPPPVDLIVGDELQYVVAGELGLLADPETEDLFYMRLLEKQLLQYEHKAREKQGKGPFIACLDYSGSMDGQPQVFALALF